MFKPLKLRVEEWSKLLAYIAQQLDEAVVEYEDGVMLPESESRVKNLQELYNACLKNAPRP